MARRLNQDLARAAYVAASFVLALFLVKFGEALTNVSLAGFGILPRTTRGLIGIVFSPLLHADLAHLLANAGPMFALLFVTFSDRRYKPAAALAFIWFLSGLGTWLIGRNHQGAEPVIHVGASSIIYGLASYLVTAGFLLRSWRAAIMAVIIVVLYGGLIFGALPQRGFVSWEGHLCGVIAGIWAARKLLGN